ncbi:g6825 [Coccomyxa elongata]
MESDIRAAFGSKNYKFADDDLESRCANLALDNDMSAEELALEYERIMITRLATSNKVTETDLEVLAHELERTKAKRAAKRSAATAFGRTTRDSIAILVDATNRNSKTPLRTPAAKASAASSAQRKTPTSTSFHSRSQAGQVVKTLNAHIDFSISDVSTSEVDGAPRCRVDLVRPGLRAGHKFMDNRIPARVAFLEARMLHFCAALEAATGCPACHPVGLPTQEPTMFVGRVVCDAEGHLNANSLLLEGTLKHSQGASVKLDVSRLSSYRLFPGQVVGVHGLNPSGKCLVANQLISSLPRPFARSTPDDLRRFTIATGAGGVNMTVAVGPFTTLEDLEFAPLAELLSSCCTSPPDILLLIGPFVDVEHTLISSGSLDITFEELFETQVLDRLRDFAEANPATQVLLMPSGRDAHADPLFPQAAFPAARGLPASVRLLPNPATFRANEIVIGAASPDFLKQVSAQEISKGPTPDRMTALASHVIGQGSYFPLYPPAPGSMLDASLGAELDLPCTPDILILPSDLAPFAKLVAAESPAKSGVAADAANTDALAGGDVGTRQRLVMGNVVCVNPGRLAKDKSGGTFAKLQVGASKEGLALAAGQPPETNGGLQHAVDERCLVEIRKI